MLYLLKENQGAGVFYLFQNKEYVVGRKNADIVISNDQSISRKHAVIKVGFSSVTLTDCGSKYGTTHNQSKMEANTNTLIKDGDTIKFGVFESKYRFEKLNIITTASGLTDEQKKSLKKALQTLGGSVVNNYDDTCTHVTAHEIMLTVKVLHAVIDDKPIVNLNFWDTYVANVKAAKAPPKVEEFKPRITEALINRINLTPNPARKVVFNDKVFVFTLEKVKARMEALIRKTGGSSISFERQPISLSDVKGAKKKYIFIQNTVEEDIPKELNNIYKYLVQIKERVIPIQEIALAVVHCSTEKDCNPKFARRDHVLNAKPVDSKSEVFSLAQETPDDGLDQSFEPKREIVIPESLDAELEAFPVPSTSSGTSSTSTFKRPQEVPYNPPKKLKLESNIAKTPEKENNLTKSGSVEIKKEAVLESKKRKSDEVLASSSKKPPTFVPNKSEQNVSTIVSKRKADIDDDFWPTSKPSTSKKRCVTIDDDPDNPFLNIEVKRETADHKADDDNPFLKILNENRKKVSAVKPPIIEPKIEITAVSANEDYVPSDTSGINWICSNDNNVSKQEIDPELQEIFDQFENSIVIEVLPSSAFIKPITPYSTQSSLNTSTEKKNFKKFKKVRPLRPQTTILTTAIYENIAQSDGEEDEEAPPRPQPKKKTSNFEF